MTTRKPSDSDSYLHEHMSRRILIITARRALAGSEAAASIMERFRPNSTSERELEVFAEYDAQRRKRFH